MWSYLSNEGCVVRVEIAFVLVWYKHRDHSDWPVSFEFQSKL